MGVTVGEARRESSRSQWSLQMVNIVRHEKRINGCICLVIQFVSIWAIQPWSPNQSWKLGCCYSLGPKLRWINPPGSLSNFMGLKKKKKKKLGNSLHLICPKVSILFITDDTFMLGFVETILCTNFLLQSRYYISSNVCPFCIFSL